MKSPSKGDNGFLNFRTIISGVICAYIMTLLLFFILSLMLYFTKVSEAIIPSAVTIICVVSILFCSIMVTKDVKKLGWLHGGLIGLIYVILLLIMGTTLGGSRPPIWSALVDLLVGFFTGVFSGILGVNL